MDGIHKNWLQMSFCTFSRKHGAPPKSQQQWGAKQVCEQLNRDACTK
jgi:hypothetical protein